MGPARLVSATWQGTEDVFGGGTNRRGPRLCCREGPIPLTRLALPTMMEGRLLRSELTLMQKVNRISYFSSGNSVFNPVLEYKCEQKTKNHQTLKENPSKRNIECNKLKNSLQGNSVNRKRRQLENNHENKIILLLRSSMFNKIRTSYYFLNSWELTIWSKNKYTV